MERILRLLDEIDALICALILLWPGLHGRRARRTATGLLLFGITVGAQALGF